MTRYYDSDRGLAEYLLFHYGAPEDQLPWSFGPRDALEFPERCARLGPRFDLLPENATALDLGCAVGRSTFELARHCGRVVGIDAAPRFIAAAKEMQAAGGMEIRVLMEGNWFETRRIRRPDGVDPARVEFEVGDALALRPDLGRFDLVLAANLLDRLPRPAAFLKACEGLVKPGGQLVLTSPYTWLEEYTEEKEWLSGRDRSASANLAGLLPGFRLAGRQDMPFLIREHRRKFQWSVAEVTTWVRGEREARCAL